jgi:predicted  nucleic acid-binding Zn-ribbon protein
MESGPLRLVRVETVRCLGCGKVYGKPSGRGTLRANPGCPDCGYVGWLPKGDALSGASPRDRSAADPRPHRLRRSG